MDNENLIITGDVSDSELNSVNLTIASENVDNADVTASMVNIYGANSAGVISAANVNVAGTIKKNNDPLLVASEAQTMINNYEPAGSVTSSNKKAVSGSAVYDALTDYVKFPNWANFTNLTLGNTGGTYTATDNCYVISESVYSQNNALLLFSINGCEFYRNATSSVLRLSIEIILKKGDTFTINVQSGTLANNSWKIVPLN